MDSPTFSPINSTMYRELELWGLEEEDEYGYHDQGEMLIEKTSYSPWPASPGMALENFLSGSNIEKQEIHFLNAVDPLPQSIVASSTSNMPSAGETVLNESNVLESVDICGHDQVDMVEIDEEKEEFNDQVQQKPAENDNLPSKKMIIKGQWMPEEDCLLVRLVNEIGDKNWSIISTHFAGRNGKQCRERWHNNLHPGIIKKVKWTEEEEKQLIEAQKIFGNRWAEIAKHMPGRSANFIKNRWNACKRRENTLTKIGKKVSRAENRLRSSSCDVMPSPSTMIPPAEASETKHLTETEVQLDNSFLQNDLLGQTQMSNNFCPDGNLADDIPSYSQNPIMLIDLPSSHEGSSNSVIGHSNYNMPYLAEGEAFSSSSAVVQDVVGLKMAYLLEEGDSSSLLDVQDDESINKYISYLLDEGANLSSPPIAGVQEVQMTLPPAAAFGARN